MNNVNPNLSPISVSVYNRFSHFKDTIESLKSNVLADESVLYIFSDGALPGDERVVSEIREYAAEVKGFGSLVLDFKEVNTFRKNMADAREIPIRKHGSVIRLEDDIVSAPGFLSFMNSAMSFYENDPKVLNVTGYCPPISLPRNYSNDYFVLPRPCPWGMGFWDEALSVISNSFDEKDYIDAVNDLDFSLVGKDVRQLINSQLKGTFKAGDVSCMFHQLKNLKYTIYPRRSLVQNIGHDGTGLHSGVTTKYRHSELWDKVEGFSFDKDLQLNPDIIRSNYKFRSPGVFKKVIARLERTYHNFGK